MTDEQRLERYWDRLLAKEQAVVMLPAKVEEKPKPKPATRVVQLVDKREDTRTSSLMCKRCRNSFIHLKDSIRGIQFCVACQLVMNPKKFEGVRSAAESDRAGSCTGCKEFSVFIQQGKCRKCRGISSQPQELYSRVLCFTCGKRLANKGSDNPKWPTCTQCAVEGVVREGDRRASLAHDHTRGTDSCTVCLPLTPEHERPVELTEQGENDTPLQFEAYKHAIQEFFQGHAEDDGVQYACGWDGYEIGGEG